MAYTHAAGRIILHSWGRFRARAATTIAAGEMGYFASSAGILQATQTTTASAITSAADCVACEKIESGATGWFALAVEMKDPATIAAGGVVTQGSVVADTSEICEALYLAATAGQAVSGATTASSLLIKQYVGFVTAIDRYILGPGNLAMNSFILPTCTP